MPDNRCCRYIERRTLLVRSSFASDHDHKSYARRRAGPRRTRMGKLRSPWQAKPPAPPPPPPPSWCVLLVFFFFFFVFFSLFFVENSLAAEFVFVPFERKNFDQN